MVDALDQFQKGAGEREGWGLLGTRVGQESHCWEQDRHCCDQDVKHVDDHVCAEHPPGKRLAA